MLDMTARVFDFPRAGIQAERTIRATVRGLLKGKGLSVEDVAPHVGLSPSTLYRKLSGEGAFKAGEVADLARLLGVTVSQLYDGLGGTFVPPEDPGAEARARRDSNPQPSDPKVLVLSKVA